ncbi:hypothetical protein V8352_13720 [Roseovarius sp. D0-M9]
MLRAAKEIVEDRDPRADLGEVMVTLEGTIACVLLVVMDADHEKAAGMLNLGLVEGVEARLAHHAEKLNHRKADK